PGGDRPPLRVLRHTARLHAAECARPGPGGRARGCARGRRALAPHPDGWHAACLGPVPSPGPDWLHGPEGGRYVRAWAVPWAADAIAAGVDETIARQGEGGFVRHQLRG